MNWLVEVRGIPPFSEEREGMGHGTLRVEKGRLPLGSWRPTLDHPNDEDLRLGTLKSQNKNAARVGRPYSLERQICILEHG